MQIQVDVEKLREHLALMNRELHKAEELLGKLNEACKHLYSIESLRDMLERASCGMRQVKEILDRLIENAESLSRNTEESFHELNCRAESLF